MDPQQKKIIKIGVIGFVAVMCGLLAWTLSTLGVIEISNYKGGDYQIQKEGENTPVTKTGDRNIVQSGKYTVHYEKDGIMQTASVEVPNFLRSVTVLFKENPGQGQIKVERVATEVLPKLALGKNNVVKSVDVNKSNGYMFEHNKDDPSGLLTKVEDAPFSPDSGAVSNNKLIGFKPGSALDISNLSIYDFVSGNIQNAKKEYAADGGNVILAPSTSNNNMFGVLQGDDTTSLDVYDGTQLKSTFSNLSVVAEGTDTARVIAISKNYVAMGYGERAIVGDHSLEGEAGNIEPKNFTIKLFDVNTKQEKLSFSIGKTNTVASIQVTDDGAFVSVAKDESLEVYNTKSKSKIFTTNLAYTTNHQWRDNKRLLYATVEAGLFEYDTSKQTAANLFSNNVIRMSNFTIYDNKVLFTAFSKQDKTALPEAYIAYLTETTDNNNALVNFLPYITTEIKITAINNVIYAAENDRPFEGGTNPEFRTITPSPSLETKVTNYLEKNIPDYKKYKLVYGVNL